MPDHEDPPLSEATEAKKWPASLWVSTSYFAEGYPYTIINNLAEVLFTAMGASLGAIGLTSLLHLPWNLKFLWGPLVDEYETKRRWMLGIELAISIALVAAVPLWMLPTATIFQGLSLFRPEPALGALKWLGLGFLFLAFLASTHDIAIDGFYLEALDDKGQSRHVGLRAFAYKIASLIVRGPLLILIGYVGWRWGFVTLAILMALLTAVHAVILPRTERRRQPLSALLRRLATPKKLFFAVVLVALAVAESKVPTLRPLGSRMAHELAKVPVLGKVRSGGWVGLLLLLSLLVLLGLRRRIEARIGQSSSHYAKAFGSFLAQPSIGRVLAFVVLFRTGESFLMKMKVPFLQRQLGMSLAEYGWSNGTIGVVASFCATLLGGWLISRDGLRRWIWPFVMAQNVLNLLYFVLAESGAVSLPAIVAVIACENFGEGLGTAVFMVYLMRCCEQEHKAAHMAVLTAVMSLSFTIAGTTSGYIAESMGYSGYFVFCFLATLPGMLLIRGLPYVDGREQKQGS